jgi:FAD/FMN-containing dehydrogenase
MLILIPFYNGSAVAAKEKFAPFYGAGPVVDMTTEMPYSAVNGVQNPMATAGDRKLFKATAFTKLAPPRFQAMFDAYAQLMHKHPEAKGSAIIVELHPHAKVTAVPTSVTAFANRGPWFNINYSLRWKDAALDSTFRSWAAEQVEAIRKAEPEDLAGTRAYANYGLGDERTRDVFGENYERLAQVKAKYDPNIVFNKWFPITPAKA